MFNLKDSEVEYCTHETLNNTHYYHIRLVNRGGRCSCGIFTKKVKDYYNRKITHSIFTNENAVIIYNARRFKCPSCGSTFYESNPFSSTYSNASDITVNNCLKLLKLYNETFSSVARKMNISVTEVVKIFDQHVQPTRNKLSSVIGIDEFYFSRKAKNKYTLMILSLDKGYLVDILESRHKSDLKNYFKNISNEERLNVKYVSIDMNNVYRDIVHMYFPNAYLCVDPFHVIKLINKALDNIRLSLLHKYENNKSGDEYYLLKYRKDLLYKESEYDQFNKPKYNHHFSYEISDSDKLNMMLDLNPKLKTSYFIKEDYMIFNDTINDYETKKEELEIIIQKCINSDIAELISIGLTLENWKEEILNSFITYNKRKHTRTNTREIQTVRVTNGPVEGRNKYIKIILRLANGYGNFTRFRNRTLYVLNKKTEYSETLISKKVAKSKK